LPNAGKSTMLSTISAARPKIGDYPFTTLSPVLGLVPLGFDRGFVVADLPGIIEGAHKGKGLGGQFLKHIERTRVIVVLIDSTDDDPEESYRVLMNELESYGEGLDEKLRIVVLTKADIAVDGVSEAVSFGGERVLLVSAVTGQGIEEMKHAVRQLLDGAAGLSA
ncbi:50S ribosome-binding GTPase, partial [bacterium]|nr:50S ribosome-binding GTPase [bacterium]